MNPPGPGRPRALSRSLIVTAARRIADEEGLTALTVRRVARRLGTGQASLYRHIADRGQLLLLLAEQVAAQLPPPAPDPEPRQRVRRHWLAAHDHLSRHPWATGILAGSPYPPSGTAGFARDALDALTAAGLPRDEAVRAHRALWNLLLGHLQGARPARSDFDWALSRLLDGALGRRPAGLPG
ncbi:TetR/AcrR family transcriptional regulator [Streptomyces orinoci]|uniref:Helix-turn-helix domain-containing protein n=1 Tax=Streptomyces orinoci TaxID=67339 RepID=A0ABV3JRB4_STRON|nr:TetR/AcrR family transcriptional regulator [Streptomyces orinoci]